MAKYGLEQPNSKAEWLIILAVLSVFLNAALTALLAVGVTIWVVTDSDRSARFMAGPHARWLLPFSVLVMVVPAVYGNWLGFVVGILILCFLCLALFIVTHMTPALQRRLLDFVCLMSVPVAAIAFVQRSLLGVERTPSVFQNPNYYGAVIEFIVLIAVNQLLARRRPLHRVYYAGIILVNLVALNATDSRSAWLAVLVGTLTLLVLNRRYFTSVAVLLASVACFHLSTLMPALFPRMDQLAVAADVRADIWLHALRAIRGNPAFGTGAMSYYHLSNGLYYHAHNLYLDLLLNYGVVGCLMLAGFLLPLFRGALRGFVDNRTPGSPYALLFAGTVAVLVHGLTDVTILWPQTAVLFSLLLSCSAFQDMPVMALPSLPLPPAKQPAYRLPH